MSKTNLALRTPRAVVVPLVAARTKLAWPFTDYMTPPSIEAANAERYREVNPKLGKAKGRAAMKAVAARNAKWIARGYNFVIRMRATKASDRTFRITGEEIGLLVCKKFGDPPTSRNAIGSFIGSLVKKGILVHVGRSQPLVVSTSHGRRTPVYKFS